MKKNILKEWYLLKLILHPDLDQPCVHSWWKLQTWQRYLVFGTCHYPFSYFETKVDSVKNASTLKFCLSKIKIMSRNYYSIRFLRKTFFHLMTSIIIPHLYHSEADSLKSITGRWEKHHISLGMTIIHMFLENVTQSRPSLWFFCCWFFLYPPVLDADDSIKVSLLQMRTNQNFRDWTWLILVSFCNYNKQFMDVLLGWYEGFSTPAVNFSHRATPLGKYDCFG